MKLTTLLTFTAIALMISTVGSAGLRGLQSASLDNSAIAASVSAPSIKIAGVSQLVQALSSAGDFTNAAFDVITLNSFSQNETEDGDVYEAKLTIANDQGVSVNALVNGVWDAENENVVFSASTYEIETEETEGESTSDASDDGDNNNSTNSTSSVDADGYVNIDIAVAQNDSQVSAAFQWAWNALIATGERQNKIPTSDYAVTNWISASSKNRTSNIGYRFVAELLGANYVHVETNMTVFYNPADQSYRLAGYYYRASNITKGSLPNNNTDVNNGNSTNVNNNSTDANNSTDVSNNSTDANNSTNIDNNATVIDNNSTVIDNNSTEVNNNATNTTNSTIATPAVPAGYTYLSQADLANNTQAQAALAWGNDALIQKGISQYKIPAASAQYNVTNYIWGAYKNSSTGATYMFNTNLTNALKYKVDVNITVSYRASNQTYKLSAYSFRSYNYPSKAIVIPSNNTNNNATNNATNNSSSNSSVTVPNNNTTVVDNSTVVAPVNNTQPADNSTVVAPVNNTQPANNSTVVVPPVNQTSNSSGYQQINNISANPQAQDALAWGINNIVQKGLRLRKIPAANPNYSVAKLVSASVQKQAKGTSYKFQVNLINVDYVHVDANLTIFYKDSSKAYSLSEYHFKSYNYSASALTNKNTTNSSQAANNTASAPATPVANSTDSATNSSTPVVADNGSNVAADNSTAVANATSTDAASAPASPGNSTVIDPATDASNASDNSTTVADNSSQPVDTVIDPLNAGSN